MGRNRKVECRICMKQMRSDILERHTKKHEKKTSGVDEFETLSSDALGEMKHVDKDENSMNGAFAGMKHIDEAGTNRRVTSPEKCMNLEMLEKKIVTDMKEFNRKIELGRNVKIIIKKHGFNTHGLQENMKEALKTYELYGKNIDKEEFKWLWWKMELRKYLGKQCNRKNIWVVDIEGKTFL